MTRPYRDKLTGPDVFVYRDGQQYPVEHDDDGLAYILRIRDGGYTTREYL